MMKVLNWERSDDEGIAAVDTSIGLSEISCIRL